MHKDVTMEFRKILQVPQEVIPVCYEQNQYRLYNLGP